MRSLTALPLVLTLATVSLLPSVAAAYPGNTQAFDYYRKSDNSFSFGSPTDVSNSAILCTPNPNLAPATPPPQPPASSNNGTSIAAGLGIGLGAAALGQAIFDDNDDEITVYTPSYRRYYPSNGDIYYRHGRGAIYIDR